MNVMFSMKPVMMRILNFKAVSRYTANTMRMAVALNLGLINSLKTSVSKLVVQRIVQRAINLMLTISTHANLRVTGNRVYGWELWEALLVVCFL